LNFDARSEHSQACAEARKRSLGLPIEGRSRSDQSARDGGST
jgi:hypothetical protein